MAGKFVQLDGRTYMIESTEGRTVYLRDMESYQQRVEYIPTGKGLAVI